MLKVSFMDYSIEPPPLPDETLYSILSRCFYYSERTATKNMLSNIFGSHSLSFRALNLDHLFSMAKNIQLNLTVESLAANHTFINYYRPFIDTRKLQKIVNGIFWGNANVSATIGNCRLIKSNRNYLNYCNRCAIQDQRAYGVAYWHRSHQLPGVSVCYKHGIRLNDLTAMQTISRYSLVLPVNDVKFQENKSKNHFDNQLARISHNVLTNKNKNISLPVLRSKYFGRLRELNLLKGKNRLNKLRLFSFVKELKYDFKSSQIILLDYEKASQILYNVCRQTSWFQHPLNHFITILYLFNDYGKLVSYDSDKTFIEPSKYNHTRKTIDDKLLLRLFNQGLKLGDIAEYTHTTATTVKVHLLANNVSLMAKPSKLKTTILESMYSMLLVGKTIQEVSEKLLLSKSAVEKYLQANPQLQKIRKVNRQLKIQNNHFANWLFFKRVYPSKLYQFKRDFKNSYHWLRKHGQITIIYH